MDALKTQSHKAVSIRAVIEILFSIIVYLNAKRAVINLSQVTGNVSGNSYLIDASKH